MSGESNLEFPLPPPQSKGTILIETIWSILQSRKGKGVFSNLRQELWLTFLGSQM
jgi:hypothetical protein